MNIKKLSVIAILLFTGISLYAQKKGAKIGYIDMEYILENVKSYQEAVNSLDQKVGQWKSEIDKGSKEVDLMKKTLEHERLLLTPELIEERKDDILFKEQEISDYTQKRFGPKGDLFTQRKILVQPVQDQVFVAIQEIAKAKKFDFILDKSDKLIMLYTAERFDVSDQVLAKIQKAEKKDEVKSRKEEKRLEKLARVFKKNNGVAVDSEKQQQIEDRKKATQDALEKRKAIRDSIRQKRIEEIKARKAKIIEMQNRRRDSIKKVRMEKIKTYKEAREQEKQQDSTQS